VSLLRVWHYAGILRGEGAQQSDTFRFVLNLKGIINDVLIEYLDSVYFQWLNQYHADNGE
jgi:hypothetical protein